MNENLIVAAYTMMDDVMNALGHEDHVLAKVSGAEILTVAIVAARYFRNNHERALFVMIGMGYLMNSLSVSRFNRRLHDLSDWLGLLLRLLGELFASGELFIIDSMPLPVCKRVRASRCKKVRGGEYCGYCASKKEKFFGWKLHLVCTPTGLPVAFDIVPAARHDLTPIHELTVALPSNARVLGDKAYNSRPDEHSLLDDMGVYLVPIRKKNMLPNSWADDYDLRQYRMVIETVNSQLEKMGFQHLHARTNAGFFVKVHSSLLALACANMI
jgi:hypothetical protein